MKLALQTSIWTNWHFDLTATIPATPGYGEDAPVIALFAHVDTAREMPGKGVKPRVHYNYDGKPITFPR